MTPWRGALDQPIWLEEGVVPSWSPVWCVQTIVRGLEVGGDRLPRRDIVRGTLRVLRDWWAWTTALPGDVFYDFMRDELIEVHDGLPSRRRVRVVPHQALRYSTVKTLGRSALFSIMPLEDNSFSWYTVTRWTDPSIWT
jgi:hypothetical protein